MIFFCWVGCTVHSQSFEDQFSSKLGVSIGTLYYYGDLTQNYPVISESQLAFSVFYNYALTQKMLLEVEFAYGNIRAFDNNNDPSSTIYTRNLHFRSSISEISFKAYFDILNLLLQSERGNFSSYFFIGIASFSHNPEAFYEGQWYELQPLGTEGQGLEQYPEREKYALRNISIPVGLKFSARLSNRFDIGLRIGLNKTFTDYLDDVSMPLADNAIILAEAGPIARAFADRYIDSAGNLNPQSEGTNRGNPNNNDWYGSVNISLSYKFQGKRIARN